MTLLQSLAILFAGLLINLGTVYCMQKGSQLPSIWSWYLLGVAVTITLTQMCIMLASRNERLPLDLAIAVFIAFIMPGSALLVKTLDASRTISGWEWFFYGVAIVGVLGVGMSRHLHS